MKPNLVVIGSSNTDMIIKLDRIPRPGETVLGGEFVTAAGGKGANQAVGASRAGGQVTFIARVGNDIFGTQAIAGFQKDGINIDYVFGDKKTPSGVALIFVAKDGENSIAVAGGANAKLSPADIKKARKAIIHSNALIMQLETPLDTVQCAADIAFKAGVPVILNPAPAQSLSDSLLKQISIITPNESEAELLTGIKISDDTTAAKAATKLLDMGVKTAIITLGSAGAFVATREQQERIPAFKVHAVDSTAAGDIFNGSLAVALGEGKSLVDSVRFANAAAAISVTRFGAQPSAPTRREIEKLLQCA